MKYLVINIKHSNRIHQFFAKGIPGQYSGRAYGNVVERENGMGRKVL